MEIKLELVIGRKVFTLNNRPLGRIEEVRAELRDGRCYVVEYLVGTYAFFERLSAAALGRAILGIFGKSLKIGYRIPWDKLDFKDPENPRLKCKVTQLSRM